MIEETGLDVLLYRHEVNVSIMMIDGYGLTYGDSYWLNDAGQLHRKHGPAIEKANGHLHWLVNGRRHRIDGPAVVIPTTYREYWVDGRRHRSDGPAVEYSDGAEEYWCEGKRHRIGGPAVIHPKHLREEEWWINGIRYNAPRPRI